MDIRGLSSSQKGNDWVVIISQGKWLLVAFLTFLPLATSEPPQTSILLKFGQKHESKSAIQCRCFLSLFFVRSKNSLQSLWSLVWSTSGMRDCHPKLWLVTRGKKKPGDLFEAAKKSPRFSYSSSKKSQTIRKHDKKLMFVVALSRERNWLGKETFPEFLIIGKGHIWNIPDCQERKHGKDLVSKGWERKAMPR